MSALSLPAVGGFEWQRSVALSANFLVAVEFFSDSGNGWVHNASSKSEDEVESGLLLDVVVGETSAVWLRREVP